MTHLLRFLPEIEEDALAAHAWYEEKARGLGDEFLRMFYACTGEILHNPMISLKVHQEFRRRLLRRFPYAVYFMVGGDEITIFGLFHCARDPQTLRTTLREREETKSS